MNAKLLSRSDEVMLARRIAQGDMRAKQSIVESNLGLVHAIARTFHGSGVSLDDLVQEGTIGLTRAAELFDPDRGAKFSTYAAWWIRRSIRDAIADSKVIRIPAKANRQLAAVRRAEEELKRLGPGRASDAEVAQLTELSVGTVRSLRAAAQVTASLDAPVGEDTTPLVDLVADREGVDPAATAIAHEQREHVWAMLRLLPKRHRDVLVRRYGLIGGRAQSHAEIGRALGVGEERSRQLERESLHRLRSAAETAARAA
jgi:RNA polymerase sigma factor (sigma-70 family)